MITASKSTLRAFWENRDGALARHIARVAAARDRACAEWTLSLLAVEPSDRVLQVQDLAGDSLEATAAALAEGLVVGVDPTRAPCAAALGRHRGAARSGPLQLVRARVTALPFVAGAFDKTYSVGAFPNWVDRELGLQEMRRVLRPGGMLAISFQPRWARRDQQVRDAGTELKDRVAAAGFEKVRLVYRPLRPVAAVCVLGVAESKMRGPEA